MDVQQARPFPFLLSQTNLSVFPAGEGGRLGERERGREGGTIDSRWSSIMNQQSSRKEQLASSSLSQSLAAVFSLLCRLRGETSPELRNPPLLMRVGSV